VKQRNLFGPVGFTAHQWIRGGKIRWAGEWSQDEIDAGKARDRLAKQEYFGSPSSAAGVAQQKGKRHFWGKLKWW
jgi:hypothetical protein